jgi:membrane protease YdiL (CAAX protease family)
MDSTLTQATAQPQAVATWRDGKALAAAELSIIAILFAGHLASFVPTNALLPSILVIGWVSIRLRGLRWTHSGLRSPDWRRTVAPGILIGVGFQAYAILVEEPLVRALTGETADVSSLAFLEGNLLALLALIALGWVVAGLLEEMANRGYLLSRIAELLGDSRRAWIIAVVISSLVFGLNHLYQGPAGVISSVTAGLLFGGLYLVSGRNLWLPIIAHGTLDTVGLTLIYLGMYP